VPRIKSAKKRMRQSAKANAHNRAQRSQLRTAVKKVRSAGTAEEATQAYQQAAKMLDRAGRKNLVHRNTAARQKSRLAKAAAKVGTAAK
jgi:small subunit ribosomal protein S20